MVIYPSSQGEKMKLSLKHYVIILGSLLAAYFHLVLFPDIGFTLNGLGYLGQRHKLVWWGLVGYTLLTIVLWVIMGNKQFVAGTTSAIGYYAKAPEVLLLAGLWADKPK